MKQLCAGGAMLRKNLLLLHVFCICLYYHFFACFKYIFLPCFVHRTRSNFDVWDRSRVFILQRSDKEALDFQSSKQFVDLLLRSNFFLPDLIIAVPFTRSDPFARILPSKNFQALFSCKWTNRILKNESFPNETSGFQVLFQRNSSFPSKDEPPAETTDRAPLQLH